MMMIRSAALAVTLGLICTPLWAERAEYGAVELSGLARDVSWPFNAPGPSNAMVCNVNGPDGFLTIRANPDAGSATMRRLARLAVVQVDTAQRRGHWIRVQGAYRYHDKNGRPIAPKSLPVTGWAHDGYLCSFLD
ncbi:MAG: hypothetical protein Q4G25_12880 [Paracoccus sp. (in: a-proteobacteria)]|nr:hypothetical protein [Paracoccus sp. (in: a-proteobacteria)]